MCANIKATSGHIAHDVLELDEAEVISLGYHPGSVTMPAVPLYQRVVDDIKRQIASGELAPGAQLPTGAEMQARYGVGSTAIRNAMLVLRSEGVIESIQGKGVFVTANT